MSELPRQQWRHLKAARHEVLAGTESRPLIVARWGTERTVWRRLPGQGEGLEAWFEEVVPQHSPS